MWGCAITVVRKDREKEPLWSRNREIKEVLNLEATATEL